MPASDTSGRSRTTRVIRAQRESVYRAFLDAEALAQWQAPDDMTATVHDIDARPGGGYVMTLTYPANVAGSPGKTTDHQDRYSARFVSLAQPSRIVEAITFASDDPAFSGEMIITIDLAEVEGGTEVKMAFDNIPAGIRPEDNDAGTRSSLGKLARLVEPGAMS